MSAPLGAADGRGSGRAARAPGPPGLRGANAWPLRSGGAAARRRHPPAREGGAIFSIEHEFDATVVTLVDEGTRRPLEDVVVSLFEECVTVTQPDPRTGEAVTVTLSNVQVRDLAAALNLPEGVYRRR